MVSSAVPPDAALRYTNKIIFVAYKTLTVSSFRFKNKQASSPASVAVQFYL